MLDSFISSYPITAFSIAIVIGLALLVWSSDQFVVGASATANNLGISPLVIGLTIVGFGTSAPEMLVSGFAAADGNPGLAVGNAIGSNIANIALVLGATALISPIFVKQSLLKREFALLILATAITYILIADLQLSLLDAVLMFVLLFSILGFLVWRAQKDNAEGNSSDTHEFDDEIPTDMSTKTALFWLFLGLILLLVSSKILVWGAVGIAESFGVSDLVIGLTIVAIGTSLPELAASIASALKNEHEIALGNVVGSNLFNLLAVMGLAGLINPFDIAAEAIQRDYLIMAALTLILFVISFSFKGAKHIQRWQGGALLAVFIGYQALLFISVQ